MKFIFLLCILPLLAIAKSSSAQTTIQDYNYVSKGLLDDINNGRDIKADFTLERTGISGKVSRTDGSWRDAEILLFKRKSTNRTQAYAVVCTDNSNTKRIMCIPTGDASNELWETAFKEFSSTGCEWQTVFMWALMKLTAKKLN